MKARWAIALVTAFLGASAADVAKGGFGAKKPDAPPVTVPGNQSATAKKRNSYPFHGTLASVDPSGKSITLAGKKKPRVILVTADTQVFRQGLRAKLRDGLAGERVTGTVAKNEAGQEVAATVRYGGSAAVRR